MTGFLALLVVICVLSLSGGRSHHDHAKTRSEKTADPAATAIDRETTCAFGDSGVIERDLSSPIRAKGRPDR